MDILDHAKKALVLGLGSSGLAAAKLLRGRGVAVTAVDGKAPAPAARAALEGAGAACLAPCGETLDLDADLAVASPGIPADGPWIRGLRARGIPVISEVELGWLCRGRARVLAVTGSNGKSTLVKLCAEALGRAGLRAVPAGNYGLPVCEAVTAGPWDWLVVEISTFQLETVSRFRPDIGIILNVYPNHLDRHGTMEAYAALKARLVAGLLEGDTALVQEDARRLLPEPPCGAGRLRLFGTGARADYRYEPGRVTGLAAGRTVTLAGTPFDNDILGVTAAAAAGALEAAGAAPAALEQAVAAFVMLPHRLQTVRELGGVRFVDDSKATNLAAVSAALRMCPAPVRLIAGGVYKEREVSGLKDLLVKKCAKVYGIGKTAPFLEREWGKWVVFEDCQDLVRAVKTAWREARAGDTVLLSPGGTSFDQFRNFEERGEQFTCVVQALEMEKERL